MKVRLTVAAGLMTLLVLVLAAAGMSLVLGNMRPLDPARMTVPDIGK
jgi:HAMP domain-containing protein